jgi:hypothetical protein
MAAPGVDVAGALPTEQQIVVTVVAAAVSSIADPTAASNFIDFVRRPASARAFRSKGLDLVQRPPL